MVSIETPVSGAAFDEGVPIPMQGRVIDEDYAGQLDSLAAVWSVDSGRVCEEAVIDTAGITTCEHVFSAGVSTITLTATDPDGESAMAVAEVTVNPNAAPEALIIVPTSNGSYYSDHQVVFEGSVSDVEDPAESLVVEWSSSIDGVLSVDTSPTSGGDVSGAVPLSAGDHFITMTVTDTSGRTGEDTVAISVSGANSIPECAITAPASGSFIADNETVLLEAVGTDADVPANTLTAVWQSDKDGVFGSSTPSSSGYFFFGTDALSINTHAITLTVTDEVGAICTDAILLSVGNAPDVTLDTPISGELVNWGDPISFSATVSDLEDEPSVMSMSWASDLDGVFSTQGASSSGSSTFSFDDLSIGTHTITVTVTDTDGFSALDRATVYVNGVPSVPGVTITPDPATSADTIVATITTAAVDPEGDAVNYRYAWYQDGVLTAWVTSSITAAVHARGETWTVRVYPSDGYGEGAYGFDSAYIGNGVPTAISVTISPTAAGTDDTLTAVVTGWSDADGDAEGYRHEWALNGTVISGATDATLSGTYFVRGDSLVVSATPWDGTDAGTPVVSGARVIQNTVPSTPVVAIVPELPEDDDGLECSMVTASTDLDGDAITYSYTWTKNGAATAVTTSSVDASLTTNGDTWACTCIPSDGTGTGGSATDSVVVDDYTPPGPPVLAALDPYRNEDTATITSASEATVEITLYITNSAGVTTSITTADGAGLASYALTGLTRGDPYTFYATATDAAGNVSGRSNTIGTEACDPPDDYEDATSYGDSCSDPVIDWSRLADDGLTTILITGNLLDAGDDDWYFIQTTDDLTSGYNYYRFHVEMTHGVSDYRFVVYEGGCASAYLECGSGSSTDPEGSGYSEFESFAEDIGDGGHSIPADTRQCGSGSSTSNLCDDLSSDYYIHVIRTSTTYSCENYELEISNGIW